MNNADSEWHVYRTRFLVRAKQLTTLLEFQDVLGREHCGQPGDYLIESSDGTLRIAQRGIFEDIYVAMAPGIGAPSLPGPSSGNRPLPPGSSVPVSDPKRRPSAGGGMPVGVVRVRGPVEKQPTKGGIPLVTIEIQYMGIPS